MSSKTVRLAKAVIALLNFKDHIHKVLLIYHVNSHSAKKIEQYLNNLSIETILNNLNTIILKSKKRKILKKNHIRS